MDRTSTKMGECDEGTGMNDDSLAARSEVAVSQVVRSHLLRSVVRAADGHVYEVVVRRSGFELDPNKRRGAGFGGDMDLDLFSQVFSFVIGKAFRWIWHMVRYFGGWSVGVFTATDDPVMREGKKNRFVSKRYLVERFRRRAAAEARAADLKSAISSGSLTLKR